MNNDPIGIFDSGLGGLSVWREVRALLPEESVIYFGDGKNVPYGSRPEQEVTRLTFEGVQYLVDRGAKLVVVACNTASAVALDLLRQKYDAPVVGMVPAVKPAAATTRTGVIAILATERSLEGRKFHRYAEEFASDVELIPVVGRGFVEIVENDMEDTPQARELVAEVVGPLLERGVDRIVLGCTHYPFLTGLIKEVIGGRDVQIVDPSEAIARRVRQLLAEKGMAAAPGHEPGYMFHTLAGQEYLEKMIRKSGAERDKVIS